MSTPINTGGPTFPRIEIAKACGWKFGTGNKIGLCQPLPHKGGVIPIGQLPDYLNDLNAMHEAEKILSLAQFWVYADTLKAMPPHGSLGADGYITATATQRAEAFLRTLGLWQESTPYPMPDPDSLTGKELLKRYNTPGWNSGD